VRNVPPRRLPNRAVRSREYLTSDEVDNLIRAAARVGRHGHRDATMILTAYRHGLRVGELVSLRWDQVDFKQAVLHVNRSKNGTASNHPIGKQESRSLRGLRLDKALSAYVFVTEREGPMMEANVRKILSRAGRLARLPFPVHPHMLRHPCGYKLAKLRHWISVRSRPEAKTSISMSRSIGKLFLAPSSITASAKSSQAPAGACALTFFRIETESASDQS
jgi:integrase